MSVSLQDIVTAERRIRPYIRHTPLVASPSLSSATGADVRLKLDFLQDTGAFKLRGATNRLLSLTPEERSRGVIAVSTGNHGRAVAAAASRLGVRAVVVMSTLVPQVKIDGVRSHGAEVRIAGASQDEAEVEAARLAETEGLVPVPPFDDPRIIAGQGTLGLEILKDWADVETAIIPLSGGGLLAGVAQALKSTNPAIRIIGVSLDQGGAMLASLQAGRPVCVTEPVTLADSLGGGIGLDNRYTFPMVRDLADAIVVVTETEIERAMAHLFWNDRLVVEGAGAVAAAVLLKDALPFAVPAGHRIACLCCGNAVDMHRFTEVVTQHAPPVACHQPRPSIDCPPA